MGQFDKAAKYFLSALNSDKARGIAPNRFVIRNLIRVALDMRGARAAHRFAADLFSVESNFIKKIFPTLSEGDRLASIGSLEPARWYATLATPELIATAVLQTKTITLDQLLAFDGSSTKTDPFQELLNPANASMGMMPYSQAPDESRAPKTSSSTQDFSESDSASRKAALERYSRSLFQITPKQVCNSLPDGTVVVEFLRYNHYVGRRNDELRYGALVFRSTQSSRDKQSEQLVWVPLGAADVIDKEIVALGAEIPDPLAAGIVSTRLRSLYDMVWAPIAQALPADAKNIFVCPDGQTCFLPFGALLDSDKRFLGDKQLIMYLSTARDLFQFGEKKTAANRDFMVFAAPTYEQAALGATDTQSRFRDVDARALSGLQLADLPGSRTEAEVLKTLASQQRFTPTVFLGNSANKQNVHALHQPRVVHFATHGFFLPPTAEGPPGNPMDRSGLALAGAHVTLKAMADGRALPEAANDGLLTAREVARLPLADTWIATLSACDTGRGEARDGEGVLGLRRGFLAAGVQNLMMALWKISDQETAAFMRDFYERALESSDPATALALTQREWMGRLRKERGIAAAVSNSPSSLCRGTACGQTGWCAGCDFEVFHDHSRQNRRRR